MAEGLSELQRNAFDRFTKSVMETKPKKFKLPQNWCLVINNRRIFHGRTSLSDNSNRFLKRYWISSSKHKKLEWQCLIKSFNVVIKGSMHKPTDRFYLIKGLAVGFVIAYGLMTRPIRGRVEGLVRKRVANISHLSQRTSVVGTQSEPGLRSLDQGIPRTRREASRALVGWC